MKGTNYVIGLFVYIASILLPIIVSSKAISYTHIALYAVFSLIIIAGATIDMHYYILPDEGALVLVIGGIIYSYINDQSMLVTLLSVISVGTITYGLRLISHKGFGIGDIKWFSAIAIWLTPWEIICFFYVTFCVGSLYLLLAGYRLTWWFLYGGALSMVKVQLINRQSGSLLAEWIITIGLILLLISIALPIVTTPSRYTLNGATQEVAYMLKKVQLWSMLGHKSNGKGRMLFILNKDSYTLEEDVNHHTVNISLPQNIENERSNYFFFSLGLTL